MKWDTDQDSTQCVLSRQLTMTLKKLYISQGEKSLQIRGKGELYCSGAWLLIIVFILKLFTVSSAAVFFEKTSDAFILAKESENIVPTIAEFFEGPDEEDVDGDDHHWHEEVFIPHDKFCDILRFTYVMCGEEVWCHVNLYLLYRNLRN